MAEGYSIFFNIKITYTCWEEIPRIEGVEKRDRFGDGGGAIFLVNFSLPVLVQFCKDELEVI